MCKSAARKKDTAGWVADTALAASADTAVADTEAVEHTVVQGSHSAKTAAAVVGIAAVVDIAAVDMVVDTAAGIALVAAAAANLVKLEAAAASANSVKPAVVEAVRKQASHQHARAAVLALD